MRKISKAVAAAGLAATVVVTGLSFGSAAATAAPAAAQSDRLYGPFVQNDTATTWRAIQKPTAGKPILAETFPTREAARAAAAIWSLPAAGTVGEVRGTGDDSDLCIVQGGDRVQWIAAVCDGSAKQQFSWQDVQNGYAQHGPALKSVSNTSVYLSTWQTADGSFVSGENTTGTNTVSMDDLSPFNASVKAGSVNVPDRTATLEGHAEPGTQVIINDSIPASVAADGTWSKQLSKLKLGKQDVKVEQWKDGAQLGDTITVEVDLAIAPLNVEQFFSTNVDDRVKLFGTADTSGNVVFTTPEGKKYTAPVGTDGTFEMLLPAPNKGGSYTISAAQEIPNTAGGSNLTDAVDYSINYGAGVTVVSPPEDYEHTGGPLEMNGKGQTGSTIIITEKDKPAQIIGTTPVLANGTWSLETAHLDASEHTLVATQKSKGQNTTTAEITINPGVSNELAPVSLDGPATVTPGKENTFTGKATPGAAYTVVNAAGTQIVPGTLTVNDEGHWVFKRVVSNGATKFDFKIKQSKGNLIGESQLFSIKAATSQLAPITVATTSVNPGKSNTFTGTGEPGASYRVLNASGTQIVPGNLTIDAAGKWSFERVVSTGATKLDFKIEQSKGGVTTTSGIFSIKAATSMPVTVTTKSLTAGVNNTFEGTATPGATYRVLNVSGTQIVPGTHTVDSNGDWKFERVVSAGATELRFKIEQTKGGVTTTSELFTIPTK
jgi:hypothetical protein